MQMQSCGVVWRAFLVLFVLLVSAADASGQQAAGDTIAIRGCVREGGRGTYHLDDAREAARGAAVVQSVQRRRVDLKTDMGPLLLDYVGRVAEVSGTVIDADFRDRAIHTGKRDALIGTTGREPAFASYKLKVQAIRRVAGTCR